MGHESIRQARVAALIIISVLSAGCGQPVSPLESPVTPTDVPTATSTETLTPTITTTPTPGPSPTPDTRATSESVFATITALAATPTYPPTSTPRPRRTPIGAGPEESMASPTALYRSGGITVLTMSARVIPGSAAALTVKTKPSAVCSLAVARDKAQPEPVPGIATRTAGRDGIAAWIWSVPEQQPAGIMRLVVNCGAAGRATVQMTVVK